MNKRNLNYMLSGISAIVLTIFYVLFMLFSFINNSLKNFINLVPFFTGILLYILVMLIYKIVKQSKFEKLSSNYVRDIPDEYDLPTTAFLFDDDIDMHDLVGAFKLKLKRLGIIDNENKIVDSKQIEKLSENEYYLLNLMFFNDDDRYSVNGFNDVFHKNLTLMNFAKEKFKPYFIGALVPGLLVIPVVIIGNILYINKIITYEQFNMNIMPFLILTIILFLISGIVLPIFGVTKFSYTKLAKEKRKNIVGFYGYLKSFSSLDEKEMDESPLWEKYLECAVLFNINNKYIIDHVTWLTKEEIYDIIEDLGREAKY